MPAAGRCERNNDKLRWNSSGLHVLEKVNTSAQETKARARCVTNSVSLPLGVKLFSSHKGDEPSPIPITVNNLASLYFNKDHRRRHLHNVNYIVWPNSVLHLRLERDEQLSCEATLRLLTVKIDTH